MRSGPRILHVSTQRTHIHLLVEADHKDALASGMQGFQISAAKLGDSASAWLRTRTVRLSPCNGVADPQRARGSELGDLEDNTQRGQQ